MSKFTCILLTFLVYLGFQSNAQVRFVLKEDSGKIQLVDSVKRQLDELVEKRLLKEVRSLHNKYDVKAFSRAYSTERYIYGVYKEPHRRQKGYECILQKIKGSSVVEKYKFYADLRKGSLIIMDDRNKKYIPVDQWLLFYKEKIISDQNK